jgi:rhodanese-related sulfurtransferase
MDMRLFKDMLVILVVAGAVAVVVNLFNPRGFVLVSRSSIEQRKIVAITAEEAKIKFDSDMAIFIDAREKAEFDYARIRGAMNIPASDAAAKPGSDQKFLFLNKPAEIVIYCDGASCGASGTMAKLILDRGYGRNIYVLQKGFPEWESRGYPVERGE